MKILIIDNYDSFTYNIFQFIGDIIGIKPIVYYNDVININLIESIQPQKIIISPGPGTPYNKRDRGNCDKIIQKYYKEIPILGICMGHQIIAYNFGAKIVRCNEIMHGKTSTIDLKSSSIFKNIPPKINAMRYHSLIVERASLPICFDIIADFENKVIMGIKLKRYNCFGLQFHPESIGTDYGKKILTNFIEII
jgi:anthranilate synthase/aminodeoxychorismate synthase-like glutamine amidotransferase